MIKRIVCSLAALMVLTSSVFAWDAYSFTGVYDIASASAAALASASPASSDSSSVSYPLDLTQYTGWTGFNTVNIAIDGVFSIPSVTSYDMIMPYTFTGTRNNLVPTPYVIFHGTTNSYSSSFLPKTFIFPNMNDERTNTAGPSWKYTFDSPYPESISLDGLISPYLSVAQPVVSSSFTSLALRVAIKINNGDPFYFSAGSDHRISISQVFTDYAGIQTIEFFPLFEPYTYAMNGRDVDYNIAVFMFVSGNSLILSVLDDNSALNGFNSEAQDSINDHESIESEWTGSMTTNFDALDMDNFTFPSGLVSGFGLITGIFQDLWNAMGEYKILFVFPLTLGVALLLIGRISKFSGGQSSSRSNRGDDGA